MWQSAAGISRSRSVSNRRILGGSAKHSTPRMATAGACRARTCRPTWIQSSDSGHSCHRRSSLLLSSGQGLYIRQVIIDWFLLCCCTGSTTSLKYTLIANVTRILSRSLRIRYGPWYGNQPWLASYFCLVEDNRQHSVRFPAPVQVIERISEFLGHHAHRMPYMLTLLGFFSVGN